MGLKKGYGKKGAFGSFATSASKIIGSATAFIIALLLVVIWGGLGPFLSFSQSWQSFIHTSTAIVTFLIVFLIQNTENRETMAIELKLDELLRAVKDARTSLIKLEDLPEKEVKRLEHELRQMQQSSD